eukprot:jgi/Phyca11/18336/fgenesh1_pg.PHYCAscaffold_35_\
MTFFESANATVQAKHAVVCLLAPNTETTVTTDIKLDAINSVVVTSSSSDVSRYDGNTAVIRGSTIACSSTNSGVPGSSFVGSSAYLVVANPAYLVVANPAYLVVANPANLVVANPAYLVVANPAYLVVANPAYLV